MTFNEETRYKFQVPELNVFEPVRIPHSKSPILQYIHNDNVNKYHMIQFTYMVYIYIS
jgi:hypothetical protein